MNSLRSTFCYLYFHYGSVHMRVPKGIHLVLVELAHYLSSISSPDVCSSTFLFRLFLIVNCEEQMGEAPLKRAVNHHLYNCFNLDIQIVLRLNVYYRCYLHGHDLLLNCIMVLFHDRYVKSFLKIGSWSKRFQF